MIAKCDHCLHWCADVRERVYRIVVLELCGECAFDFEFELASGDEEERAAA